MIVSRVEFDSTLDEGVETQLRMTKATRAYHRQRLRSQLVVAIAAGLALITSFLSRAENPSASIVVIAVGAGLALSALSWYFYGLFHDWYIWRNARRYLSELYGTAAVHCVFEVRENGLWAKLGDTEILFAWTRFVRMLDEDDVELWFNPGLAMIRGRAFATAEQRRDFLEAIKRRTA